MPRDSRKNISSRSSVLAENDSTIIASFLAPIPSISSRCRGSRSRISSVFRPNRATIRCAIAGPIPLTAPDAKKRSIAGNVAGWMRRITSPRNCLPYLGCVIQLPDTSTSSPGSGAPVLPVTTTMPLSVFKRKTTYSFWPWNVIFSTTPVKTSIIHPISCPIIKSKKYFFRSAGFLQSIAYNQCGNHSSL